MDEAGDEGATIHPIAGQRVEGDDGTVLTVSEMVVRLRSDSPQKYRACVTVKAELEPVWTVDPDLLGED
jgi:hypothetical protein